MIYGIILAGGYSSRAKTNKMLFKFNGKALICFSVDSLLSSVDQVIVVTGHYDKDIREVLSPYQNIQIVYNLDYAHGMFSSIQCGVSHVSGDVLILPGDCPFVKEETIQNIIHGQSDICVPEYENEHGHPIFIRANLVEELKKEPVDYNLKAFRNSHNYEIIKTTDKNILNDIDTINDYQDLNKNLGGK